MSDIIVILSPTIPPEVMQQLLALVVAPPKKEGNIHNATVGINTGIRMSASAGALSSGDVQLRLVTKDAPQTSEEFSWLQFRIDLETICHVVEIVAGILAILAFLKPYIQDIRELDTDMIVPFENWWKE